MTTDSVVKIETGVPLPKRIRNRFLVGRMPLDELNPGDSFLVEVPPEKIGQAVHSIRVRLTRYAAANKGKRFSSSKDPGGKGIRVWRIE